MKVLRVSPVGSGERGAVAIIVGLVALFVGAGFAALAIDLGHLYVARNQLQNAADAGALAGAQALYNESGTAINTDANDIAYTAAQRNYSEGEPVESYFVGGTINSGDIQRGHWSFGLGVNTTPGFHPSNSEDVIALAGKSEEELDDMDGEDGRPIFINAVRVVTRREAKPVRNFFARILGRPSSKVSAEAVAYRGYAGELMPGEVDAPIAICEESLVPIGDEDEYCTMGRMINSSTSVQSNDTAAWTDFYQAGTGGEDKDPCSGGTNAADVVALLQTDEGGTTHPCGEGNPYGLTNEDMATIGGEVTSALAALIDCWTSEWATNTRVNEEGQPLDCQDVPCKEYPEGEDCVPCEDPIDWYTGTDKDDQVPDGIPDEPWSLTLPTILCGDENPGPCNEMTGAVTLKIVWITRQGTDPQYALVPTHMGDWGPNLINDPEHPYPVQGANESDKDFRKRLWASFVDYFELINVDESPAPYADMSIYFKPECDRLKVAGVTGGHNFGVLAKVPVLVK